MLNNILRSKFNMEILFLLFICIATIPILTNCVVPRVLEGDTGKIEEHKWLVSVFAKSLLNYKCGGALISYNWVLTSGHCTKIQNVSYWIRAGSNMTNVGGVVTKVDAKYHFARYQYVDKFNSLHDLALLRLEDDIFGENIEQVQLPRTNEVLSTGSKVTIAGWGRIKDKHEPTTRPAKHFPFRDIVMSVVDFNKYPKRPTVAVDKIDVNNVQALVYKGCGGNGACEADIGSPVVRNGVVYGVILPGHDCGGSKQYVTIMTKVSLYTKWIHEIINSNYTNPDIAMKVTVQTNATSI